MALVNQAQSSRARSLIARAFAEGDQAAVFDALVKVQPSAVTTIIDEYMEVASALPRASLRWIAITASTTGQCICQLGAPHLCRLLWPDEEQGSWSRSVTNGCRSW